MLKKKATKGLRNTKEEKACLYLEVFINQSNTMKIEKIDQKIENLTDFEKLIFLLNYIEFNFQN